MQAEVTWEKEDKDIWECICEPKKKKKYKCTNILFFFQDTIRGQGLEIMRKMLPMTMKTYLE